jgi:phosphoglycolate phosphatase
MTPRLLLFDIDGTLLSAGRVFRRALADALVATFGTTGPIDTFEFSGRTDPEIVRGLMRGGGLGDVEIDRRLAEALARYESNLLPELSTQSVLAKPGVLALVARLATQPQLTLGLLTGNVERCARAKLAPLDLNRHFPFGAYGSDHEDRHALPAIAVERAHAATGRRFAGKRIVVVGDSIHDVRCGRHLNVRAVAVASGSTSRERLSAESPDALLDDFSDAEAALAALLGDDATP